MIQLNRGDQGQHQQQWMALINFVINAANYPIEKVTFHQFIFAGHIIVVG